MQTSYRYLNAISESDLELKGNITLKWITKVARSSVLSKLWSFSILHQLNSTKLADVLLNNYDHNFDRTEDPALKLNGL